MRRLSPLILRPQNLWCNVKRLSCADCFSDASKTARACSEPRRKRPGQQVQNVSLRMYGSWSENWNGKATLARHVKFLSSTNHEYILKKYQFKYEHYYCNHQIISARSKDPPAQIAFRTRPHLANARDSLLPVPWAPKTSIRPPPNPAPYPARHD